jgi:hypothetical protein
MFRSFTQEFIYVVNIGKKRVGPFAAPKIFRFAAYPEPYTGQPGQICQYSGYFRMDYELAATYNTAAGIGIEAAKADVGAKVKGLDWRLLLLGPVIVAACFFGFRWFGGVWVKSVLPTVKKPAAMSNMRPVSAAPTSETPSPPPAPFVPKAPVENAHGKAGGEDKEVYMTGWVMEGGKARAALSDGRWVGQGDGLTQITQSYCIVRGKIYRTRPPEEQSNFQREKGGKYH